MHGTTGPQSGTAEGDEAVISPQGKALSSSAAGDGGRRYDYPPGEEVSGSRPTHRQPHGQGCEKYSTPSKGSKGADGGWSVQPEGTGAAGSTGWGVRYTSTETYTENENTGFFSAGHGHGERKRIRLQCLPPHGAVPFSVSESVDLRAGDALKDPLAINFGQGPVGLSGQKVKFDINMDGSKEDMPLLSGGSGFLAIRQKRKTVRSTMDRSFSVLPPETASRKLAALDEDKNGWIDEGDSAYGQLRIWVKNGDRESLETLKGLDIGAICTEGGLHPPSRSRIP